MLYFFVFFFFTIIIMDWLPLWKKEEKDWTTIFLLSFLLLIGLLLSIIQEFWSIETPSIATILNNFFKNLLPSFYEFMKV